MKLLKATFDIKPVVRLTNLADCFNCKPENRSAFQVFHTLDDTIEGDAQSVMAFIGFLSDTGEDSLLTVVTTEE